MSEQDISELFADVTEDLLRKIMVGTSLDIHKIKNVNFAKMAAIHCVLNGPVGVNKLTTFPGINDEFKLKDLYDGRLSNKMWRNFCRVVAENVVRRHATIAEGSQQYLLNGNVWPLHED